jgi:DNA repair protein RecN (Recombination protein N)
MIVGTGDAAHARFETMLTEILIRNFALIDELRLEFGRGLTVLTGETGAGKSIIIGALNAVLGERVGPEAIRTGETAAQVEAVFDIGGTPEACAVLQEAGLAAEGEECLILSREIASGRSQYRVNRRAATLSLVQSLGQHLVDIHGQHEHQALIHEEHHLQFLDSFGGAEHLKLRETYAELHEAFTHTRSELASLMADERSLAQRLDLLRFQVEEIDAAELYDGEEEELLSERTRLAHAEKLQGGLAAAQDALDGDEGLAATDALQQARHELSSLAAIDGGLGPILADVEAALFTTQEAARALAAYADHVEHNPARLEIVEGRLDFITRLKRKYGESIAAVLAHRESAASELANINSAEQRRSDLEAELERLREKAGEAAEMLSASRGNLAEKLSRTIEAEVAQLGMPAAHFAVDLQREADEQGLVCAGGLRCRADRRGVDLCRFMLSANAGEELRPLRAVASGGELSRLMLAFKSICSRGTEIPTIVFDEVDSGVGGLTAHAVAEKLKALSTTAQVLCITHLPQIARVADYQIRVTKHVKAGRTTVRAEALEGDARVRDVARMLGATEGDEKALEHAREMLSTAG